MTGMQRTGAALCLLGAGALAGWAAAPRAAAPEPTPELEAVRQEIGALRQEVRQAAPPSWPAPSSWPSDRARGPSGSDATPSQRVAETSRDYVAEGAPAEPDAETLEATDEATRLVDDALVRGEWTEDDARRMREELGRVRDAEAHRAIAGRLIRALNRGEIALAAGASPF